MRFIALEEHMMPSDIAAEAGIDLGGYSAMEDELDDVTAKRLPAMDEAGIDMQVLSVLNAGVQTLGAEKATSVSRKLNDRLYDVVEQHPDKFRAFASLPMCDPAAAADELERAVTELGCVGTLIAGHTNGVFLDDPSVAPVLGAAERLGVPIYLHPTLPPPTVFDAYFSGLDPKVALSLSSAGWGWHAETGLHVLRMAASGVFERHPGLQVIVGHMGEGLPFSLARSNDRLNRLANLPRSIADVIHQHLWITTCGYTTDPPLLCASMVLGTDRIMFSVDYPFSDSLEATRFLTGAPLSPSDLEKIAHQNARMLLNL